MVKVAVAGGTGGIGRHIVEGILEKKKHEVIVLSRGASCPELESQGAKIIAVSYDDTTSLINALAGVHTVISTIGGRDAWKPVQLALLDASVKAGVRRFAPSEFVIRATADHPVELYRLKWPVSEAVMKSGLEYTFFENGVFMNYLASGTPGVGHLKPLKFIWDVENCTARIPGDGSSYVVFTCAEDVGKFVAASLDLEKWPEVSRMKGDTKTLNEVVKLAEKSRGKSFNLAYIPREEVENTIANEGFTIAKFYAQSFLLMMTEGSYGSTDANLNELCPHVQPMTVDEFLDKWWAAA